MTLSDVEQSLWSRLRRCPSSCAIVRLLRSELRVCQLAGSVIVLSVVNSPAELVFPGLDSAHPLDTLPSATFTQLPFVPHGLVTRSNVTPVPLSRLFQALMASS